MDTWFVFALASVVLFAIGLQEVLARPSLIRIVIALNVMGSATLLFLVSLAHRNPAGPDPVPHALALTGIVITLAATAAGLALARGLDRLRAGHLHRGTSDGTDERGASGRTDR
jgi:multicomponent Na+:H+ antiporter subunit C